ncbi:MAG: DUF3226 domain-containing protein [Gammaproteobacteria bacterium]
MDPRRPPHRPITKPRQLLVEGRTPQLFFEVLTTYLQISDAEIHDFRSNEQFPGYLKGFCARPEFKEQVKSLGIIRDAESLPEARQPRPAGAAASAAFDSVCHSLGAAGQPRPEQMGSFSDGPPRIGVFILPNCRDDSMLETLCLESVQTNGTSKCLGDFFACMAAAGVLTARNMTKAKTFAVLAAKDISDPLVGRAAQKGIWPWSHVAFQQLTQFLRAL